jgi:putative transposase
LKRAFKFLLYPNDYQAGRFEFTLDLHRRLYNDALGWRKASWERDHKGVCYGDQSAELKELRAKSPQFAELNFSSCQATLRRLDKSFKAFFRRVKRGEKPGYPRFKGQGYFKSVEFPAYGDGVKLVDGKLRIQAVGLVKVKMHREIKGEIKTVRIKSEGGRWYGIFSCDLGDVEVKPSNKPPAGVDVGLEHFLTTSDGDYIKNPRFLKTELPRLRRQQRSVSRKRKGGRNRRKEIERLARTHARIANLRGEHHHKVALKLVRRYGLVAVEDLNILGMSKNHRLARAIQDVAWGRFLSTLEHKAESAGARFVRVNAKNTSQECSGCGRIVRKELSERWHKCPYCGLSLQRDHNSALVILSRALKTPARTGPVSANASALKLAC